MSLAQVLKSVVAQYDAENLLKMREKVLHLLPLLGHVMSLMGMSCCGGAADLT